MISRSGNETVPMWAIAARTMGRVGEIDDNDKRTSKERKKPIDQTQRRSCLKNWLFFRSFLVHVFSKPALSPLLPLKPTILARPY